jgi:hypothetical protein
MDVDSQYAMNSRTFILNYPKLQREYSNRGIGENRRLARQYRDHMMSFTEYWWNHPDAGRWFDAPFLQVEVEEPEPTKTSTIQSVGDQIAPSLYVFDPNNPDVPLVVDIYDDDLPDDNSDSD